MRSLAKQPAQRWTRRGLLATLWLLGGGAAQAQAWPARPLRLVVDFAPGGAAGYVARTIADPLTR